LKARISRRRFVSAGLILGGAASARTGLAESSPCVLIAEQEQGPFYVDHMLVRSRIAEDRKGVPLRLRLVVMDSRSCTPLQGAAVDLWHCDAMGLYSGYTQSKMGGPPPVGRMGEPPPGTQAGPPMGPPPEGGRGFGPPRGGGMGPTDKLTFLRGIQMTGHDGGVTFETIFPGFYDGRTNHVHFKVRLDGRRVGEKYDAGHTSHTGQLFFPEDWNLKLMAEPPYAAHTIHRTTEAEDMVFTGQHGSMAMATLVPVDAKIAAKGLIAELRVAVDPTATPKPVGVGGGPPRMRG
jgi:protocatechuate 3,4-dioxygenase beta subunit